MKVSGWIIIRAYYAMYPENPASALRGGITDFVSSVAQLFPLNGG